MDRMQSGSSKAAIYVRVSTADQHVESQLYDLRELAAQRGLDVVQEYRDSGVSGKRARRPGLDALIADARQKKFSVVLVSAFDRVARSVKHFLHVMDEFDNLGIVFISRRENVDTNGSQRHAAQCSVCTGNQSVQFAYACHLHCEDPLEVHRAD